MWALDGVRGAGLGHLVVAWKGARLVGEFEFTEGRTAAALGMCLFC